MKFRTEIPIDSSEPYLKYGDPILSLGSCFADEMGAKLSYHKFDIQVNPFGISYNPYSLQKLLNCLMGHEDLLAPVFQESRNRWHSFDLHSAFSFPTKEKFLEEIEQKRKILHNYLREARLLILTFGTARAYKLKSDGDWIANNYGYPSSYFEKSCLGLEFMEEKMAACVEALKEFNPQLKILLTLSPIRHIRDGLEENAQSKALLRILIQKMTEKYAHISYFPAYEIMMDDLRDYRFYKADLIHPNEQAQAYIWEHLIQRHMQDETQELLGRIASIQKDLNHKAFNPQSMEHQAFLRKLQQKIETLAPRIDWEDELEEIRHKLIN